MRIKHMCSTSGRHSFILLKKLLSRLIVAVLIAILVLQTKLLLQYTSNKNLEEAENQTHTTSSIFRDGKLNASVADGINFFNQNIFYNRVTKCGSSGFTKCYFKELAEKTGKFLLRTNNTYITQRFLRNRNHRIYVAQTILEKQSIPVVHTDPVFFLDFSDLKFKNWPLYINIIRDPVDRKVSRFIYDRKLANWKSSWRQYYSEKFIYKYLSLTLEECVLQQNIECSFNDSVHIEVYNATLPYWMPHQVEGIMSVFCGHQDICRYPYSLSTLAEAKKNVEEHYEIVGILEELPAFLRLLEKKIPIFSGLSTITCKQLNKDKSKFVASPELKLKLKNLMKIEYEFYEFIKQRFCNEYKQIFYNDKIPQACV